MNQGNTEYIENTERTAYAKEIENAEKKDYLDSLADKMEDLGLIESSYVNRLCDILEPIIGEAESTKEDE